MAEEDEQQTNGLSVSDPDLLNQFLLQWPTLMEEEQLPPSVPRLVLDPQTNERNMSDTPGLVDGSGVIQTRPQEMPDGSVEQIPFYYDLDADAKDLYYSMDAERRQHLLEILDRKGVPTGTWQQDLRAFQILLSESNSLGKTYEVTLRDIVEKVPDVEPDAPRVAPVRVTNPADIRKAARVAWKSYVGREPNEEEMNQLISGFQAVQVGAQRAGEGQSGGTVTAAPSLATYVEEQAYQIAPTEANAKKYLDAANMLFDNVKGL